MTKKVFPFIILVLIVVVAAVAVFLSKKPIKISDSGITKEEKVSEVKPEVDLPVASTTTKPIVAEKANKVEVAVAPIVVDKDAQTKESLKAVTRKYYSIMTSENTDLFVSDYLPEHFAYLDEVDPESAIKARQEKITSKDLEDVDKLRAFNMTIFILMGINNLDDLNRGLSSAKFSIDDVPGGEAEMEIDLNKVNSKIRGSAYIYFYKTRNNGWFLTDISS